MGGKMPIHGGMAPGNQGSALVVRAKYGRFGDFRKD